MGAVGFWVVGPVEGHSQEHPYLKGSAGVKWHHDNGIYYCHVGGLCIVKYQESLSCLHL